MRPQRGARRRRRRRGRLRAAAGGGRSRESDERRVRSAARRLPEQRGLGSAAERHRGRPQGDGGRHCRRRGVRGGGRGDRSAYGEPAAGAELHRSARRRGALRAGPRGADHLVVDPESPHPAYPPGADTRPGRGSRAGHRPRGWRRLRGEDQHLRRGVRGGGAVEAARSTHQVDRGSLRSVPRNRARARPDRLCRAGGRARGQGPRLADADHRRHRRLQHAAYRPRADTA